MPLIWSVNEETDFDLGNCKCTVNMKTHCMPTIY